jgi:hypothetical protein
LDDKSIEESYLLDNLKEIKVKTLRKDGRFMSELVIKKKKDGKL